MNNKLYVGNLAYGVRDDDLRQFFSQAGEITSATVIMERDTGRSKGFGFVEFADEAAAQEGIKLGDGVDLMGRDMKVNVARPKEDRPPRGDFGGGGGGGGGRW
ncbi:RNA-binding protein [bacterium]|jgi:cold-inducible RNA-binding protein|nr:RNA-binding protein [bacterium]MBT6832005.1 RNA-binding protein [bacterium]MBT6996715.1 RNA-binding protein [bacterium]MBT7772683.1 RNA-binding protein [bacterium]